MASDQDFIEYVVEQIVGAGVITYRKMFGEYAIYCDGKVTVLVCDNQVFVKPTESGREFIGDVVEAPAYPGAKLSFLIEDQVENREWFSQLVRLTAEELPVPKPKRKTKKKSVRRRSIE